MKKVHRTLLFLGVLIGTGVLFLFGINNQAHFYSPADVLKGHNKTICKNCHQPFKKVSSMSCSAKKCHTQGSIGNKRTIVKLHDKMKGKRCLLCHKEHVGSKEKSAKSSDHGAYSKAASCLECHKGEGDKDHKDKYVSDCARCHNAKDWKTVIFDHTLTSMSCVDCHKMAKDELHVDVKYSCTKCHGTKAWKPSTYNHDKYFLLDIDHNVSCKKCHDTGGYTKYTCLNCHEHSGAKIDSEHTEEGIRNYGDCLRCHSVKLGDKIYGTPKVDEGFGSEDERQDDD